MECASADAFTVQRLEQSKVQVVGMWKAEKTQGTLFVFVKLIRDLVFMNSTRNRGYF